MPRKRLGLIAARKSAGLSQECLAERLNVERSTVQRWESRHSAPQPWHRPRLAAALGISHGELAELLADQPSVDERVLTDSALSTMPQSGDVGGDQRALKLLGTSALETMKATHTDYDPFMQSAVEAMEFTRRAEASQLGARTLEHFESVISGIAAAFAHTMPGELFAKVRWYRLEVEDLIDGQHTLREGRNLYRYAGWLSIILAWLSWCICDTNILNSGRRKN